MLINNKEDNINHFHDVKLCSRWGGGPLLQKPVACFRSLYYSDNMHICNLRDYWSVRFSVNTHMHMQAPVAISWMESTQSHLYTENEELNPTKVDNPMIRTGGIV